MSNVLSDDKRQQIIALGRLGWSLRRIEQATADLIGLDTILFSIEVLHDAFNDSKYRPCPLLKKMVDAGLHGRKSGAGFYKY